MDDLESRLARMCAVLDDLSSESTVMVELEATIPDSPHTWDLAVDETDRHSGGRSWLVAAAAAVLLGGGTWSIGAVRRDEPPADRRPATAPIQSMPPSPSPLAPIDACRMALDAERTSTNTPATDIYGPPLPGDYDVVELDVPDSPTATQIVMSDENWVFTCLVDPSNTSGGATATGTVIPTQLTPRSEQRRPDPSGVTVEQTTWDSATEEGTTGPGTVSIVGRTGPDVSNIAAVLPDGTRLEGDIDNGWFAVRGDIGEGVSLFNERLEWTLSDSSVRSSRVDLLDATTTEERCAETTGCVPARVETLRVSAVNRGLAAQADILADGIVTTAELQQALQAHVDCLNANGVTASRTGTTLSVTVSPDMTDEARWAIEANCARAHNVLVQQAHALLDAQRRVDEG